MLRGLAVTGAVITSAGIVLAGVFSVLGVLPLIFLTEIGFVVAFGVLLDTFIVRSVLVPALTFEIGPKIWWPSKLADETHRQPEPAPEREPTAARLKVVSSGYAASSRRCRSGSSRTSSAASTFSSRCAIEPVPGIGSITGERASSHASATWPVVASWLRAISRDEAAGLGELAGGERKPGKEAQAVALADLEHVGASARSVRLKRFWTVTTSTIERASSSSRR